MNKLLLKGVVFSMLAVGFMSCESDDDEPWVEPFISTSGIYVLNQGTMGQNDAGLVYFDGSNDVLTEGIIENRNGGIKLGNTAQDMLIYGSKMYITVTKSNKIFITDLKGKILKRANNTDAIISPLENNMPLEPHSLVADQGKVYVTLYGGYVARIDTTDLDIETKMAVGKHPEKMTIVKNKLYVANAWDPSDSISVINLSDFKRESAIKVAVNPDKITSDKNNNIYVLSTGNYGNVKPTLQKIDPETNAVSIIGTDVATQMTIDGDRLLLIYKDPTDYSGSAVASLQYYDIAKGTVVNKSFVSGDVNLADASNISIDPANGNIYIATTDYVSNGSMYIFKSNGEYIKSFNTKGLNPSGAFFLSASKK